MNILFLIGNGFDLNVGLNTRFIDALKSYLKDQTTDPRIERFKADINRNFENWSDFEKQIGNYTNEYQSQEIDDFCFCVKSFKESLIEHLKKEENKIDYNLHKENISEVFNKSILYFYDGLNDSSNSLFTRIIQQANNNREAIEYNFITFNYTNVLDKCLDIVKNSKSHPIIRRVLHIHGDISKNTLIGVDNSEQIKHKEFANNEKVGWNIVKPNINDRLKNFNNRDVKSLINNSHIICLFGLSLGETDKTWWEAVGNWLKERSGQLIVFNIVETWNSIHADEEIENIDQVEKKFCLAAGISDVEKNNISERIHIGLNTDMFKINLVEPVILDGGIF